MASVEELQHLAIPLEAIKSATNNFSVENFLGQGGFGPVYKGQLSHSEQCCDVAVKRLDSKFGQGHHEFLMEIAMLSSYKHENLVSLVGFCDEDGEKILVYKLEVNGSLDKHLCSTDLTWVQRLRICLGAARGLSYLHTGVGAEHMIVHRDIKGSNILLDENWESKISDFGLSRFGPSNQQFTFLVSNVCGTMGYVDPVYMKTSILTKESDVYSFGVLLLEVLCGRPAYMSNYEDERRFLSQLAQLRYEEDKLHEIINPCLIEQMHPSSLRAFSEIAFHCLKENRRERPKMELVVKELEKASILQLDQVRITQIGTLGITQIGTWGRDTGTPWSFLIQSNHKLKKITIGHKVTGVKFLIFTTEDLHGRLHTSEKFGGSTHDAKISEINLDSDEKIIGVNGTERVHLTSLCFLTNKSTYGLFGREVNRAFLVPFELGEFVGCFGCCSRRIDSIGFYFKPKIFSKTNSTDIISTLHDSNKPWEVSTNIRTISCIRDGLLAQGCSPWSFLIQSDDKLRKITINYGDWVLSLMFTIEDRNGQLRTELFGCLQLQHRFTSEVNFDADEKLLSINGTYDQFICIRTLSFTTNKRTHGPFRKKFLGYLMERVDFSMPFDDGEFSGCYGTTCQGWGIQDICCYFKAKDFQFY